MQSPYPAVLCCTQLPGHLAVLVPPGGVRPQGEKREDQPRVAVQGSLVQGGPDYQNGTGFRQSAADQHDFDKDPESNFNKW